MKRTKSKLTAPLLAALLLVPSPGSLAAASASDFSASAIPAAALAAAPAAASGAADYTGHWAQSDFNSWVEKGLLNGYGSGIFKPDQSITRAEWVTLVNRVFRPQTTAGPQFSDVAQGKPYAADVLKAAAAGYISGYEDGTFRPDRIVSRQEAAVMLHRLFRLQPVERSAAGPSDAAKLPEWSRGAVLSLLEGGYLKGYGDGSFKGERPVTRAEALRMIGGLAGDMVTSGGTYTRQHVRNLVVSAPGVTLKDTEVSGNLYLTEGIGDGDITLERVTVKGQVYVSGGGGNSVVFKDSSAAGIVADKRGGKLRIALTGSSAAPEVKVRSGVALEEEAGLTGAGFGHVVVEGSIPPSTTVQLGGNFNTVEVTSSGEPALVVSKGRVASLVLHKTAGLRVEAGAEIVKLSLEFPGTVTVEGSGKVGYDAKFEAQIKRPQPAASAPPAPTAAPGGASPTAAPTAPPAAPAPSFSNVSVHDPSVIKDGDTYYVFGSHIDAAKSKDLLNWTRFTNGYAAKDNVLYGDLSANLAESFAWAGENDSDSKNGFAVWAPDIFWNEDYKNADGSTGAYMLYYSTSSTYIRSAIGFAVSQNIEGPYTYGDTIIYSGFTKEESYDSDSKINKKWTNTNIPDLIEDGTLQDVNPAWFDNGGAYMNKNYTNAIDPNLFYDKDGTLWMTYGSWSGGIFILEIDPATGEPKYPGKDGTTSDGRLIDRYFGTHISGGNYKSGEGPYVVYDKNTDYYYLYVTYGGLASDGGYDMRTFRSKHPDGPYTDAMGQQAVLATDGDHSGVGNKLLGNFLFSNLNAEPDFPAYGYVSSGHNSVYYDEEKGKLFNFFHTRFPSRGETHEVRVHQMFMNEDDWPVIAPHRYAGETLAKVERSSIPGTYQFVNHKKDIAALIKPTVDIALRADGTIGGSADGTWELKGDYYAELRINEAVDGGTEERIYKGVFLKQWDSTRRDNVMVFTAMSDHGEMIWGSKIVEITDAQLAANIAAGLSLGDTSKVYRNLTLPTTSVRGATISWSSSDEGVVAANGTVTRPAHGSGNATVTLTATIQAGGALAVKTFTVVVLELSGSQLEDGLVAAYDFENNLNESDARTAAGTITGNRANNSGGSITFGEGRDGQAAVFNGESGIRLPDGLVSGSSYTIGLWLNPDKLNAYTSAFFGARSDTNWISLLPYGNDAATTRMWFGSETWLDADAGLQIPVGQWTHIAFSYDAGTVKMYVNGVQKYSGTGFTDVFKGTDGKGVFALGVNYWDKPFEGKIDGLRVYERALTAETVGWLVHGEPDPAVKVSSISFASQEQPVAIGNTFTPAVTVLPANAGNRGLSWSSSNTAVAEVNAASGLVTAKSLGEAVITATAADGSGITASYTVKVTEGRIAHYTFDGSLNDALGLAGAGLVTGAKIDSPTVGSITYGDGVSGQAAVFNGASGIRLPNGLISSNHYSVSLWLKPQELTNFTTTFFGARSTSSWISLVPQNSGNVTVLWSGTAWYDAAAKSRIPAGEWTHVAFTVNNGAVKLYLNGVEAYSGSGFPDVFTGTNGVFALGVNYWDTPFKGLIDELKVYERVLSTDEVKADYLLHGGE